MDVRAMTQSIGQRFHRPVVPTVIARAMSDSPIVFSHVIGDAPMSERTLAPPLESAFAVHVHHVALLSAETWIDGKHAALPPVPVGGVCIFDLTTAPVALIHEPFEFSRFYLSRSALDDLAYEQGLPSVGGLHCTPFGRADPVIHHLALALINRRAIFGQESDSLFVDHMALAFHTHVVRAYANAPPVRVFRGGLAPWQLRRAVEWMEARLDAPVSIAEIAQQVGLSSSHLTRAFRISTGLPPHQWLLRKRIERGQAMLRTTNGTLAEVSAACGFVDQSHFTRIFRRLVGEAPGRWRDAFTSNRDFSSPP